LTFRRAGVVIGMDMTAPRRAGALLLVVLLSSWTTRGLCFMPGTGEAGPRDAHGCCKKGWTQGTPACCMAGAADEDPARIVASAPLAGPAPVVTPVASLPAAAGGTRLLAPLDRSHPPPGSLPLRI
jgi:hypothetical protein